MIFRRRCSGWSRNANALARARALRIELVQAYCGLRDAEAEPVPATSTEVPLLVRATSTEPMPFAAAEPLLVAAFTPPEPVRLPVPVTLGEGVGFCAVAAT